jgi:hypothetical protein
MMKRKGRRNINVRNEKKEDAKAVEMERKKKRGLRWWRGISEEIEVKDEAGEN